MALNDRISAMHLRQLERILTVVERTLRKTFPYDCQKRCAYSAFGIRSLLQDAGVEATLIGGDFAAFVMSLKGEKAGVQGFGFGEDQCSHFWVEADGRLIDIAPHFLPRESSYPVVPMPAIAWDLSEPLPAYLRYRVIERFPASAMMSSDATINARCDAFVSACQERLQGQVGPINFPTWVVTGPASVAKMVNRRDLWALGARRFEGLADLQDLPF